MHRFADRTAAGHALGEQLAGLGLDRPLLVGLARGGVPVAVAAAAVLGADVDVGVARKITAPERPEAGLGAVAVDGEPVWFERALHHAGLTPEALADAVAAERAEAVRREAAYGAGWRPRAAGRDVVLVDDGIATGVTVRAALGAIAAARPARLVLGVPVASPPSLARLGDVEVVAVLVPEDFRAVGDLYDDFGQLSDDDVRRVLDR
ncbi:phosphoribosyltransferase family protein [Actinomycetospora straminea]|uniref:Phosphoribosyltransferase family protein n=1 Tax=Actinomycetospora straminea TaxID=663607 RepID=A0ABP9EAF3_9PSEU|nr:phosphoribosyltransferase family protein [Actinomycetospora straminea]MDD7932054.1 phosphoribosyltransferase family protein [Actinomycetospora straminea]